MKRFRALATVGVVALAVVLLTRQVNSWLREDCAELDAESPTTVPSFSPELSNLSLELITLGNADEIEQLAQFGDAEGVINIVAFSPDGTLIAVDGPDDTVRLWSVNTGEQVFVFDTNGVFTQDLAFSPDGKLLASIGRRTLSIWDLQSGTRIENLFLADNNHDLKINFSPNNDRIAFTADTGDISLWDVAIAHNDSTFRAGDYVTGISFSPNGKCLAYGVGSFVLEGTGDVQIRNLETNLALQSFGGITHSHAPTEIVFSADGQSLVAGSTDTIIRIWDVRTGELRTTLRGHRYPVNDVAVTADGSLVASASGLDTLHNPSNGDNTVRIWDLNTATAITIFQNDLAIRAVAFNQAGTLLAAGGNDGFIRLWGVPTVE
jgi:WD40 repeat protein